MAEAPHKTPVSMLSGFLGAGKTTLLRYLLENSSERIACIVNDVAAVNIDAKLVRNDRSRAHAAAAAAGANGAAPTASSTADLADTIELANGCACCNMQDELFASLEQVLALADKNGTPYTRIVLENSGVAEPQNIRDKFAEAAAAGHPATKRVALDNLVTVVDAAAFSADFASRAPLASRPELGDGGGLRPVVDLLVEQVECADYVVLNKTDMLEGGASGDALAQLVGIVSSLNPLATVLPAQQGKVPLEQVFGGAARRVVAALNIEGQHRGAVAAARAAAAEEQEAAARDAKRAKSDDGSSGSGEGGGHAHHHAHAHAHDDKCGGKEGACTHAEHAHGGDGHKHEHDDKCGGKEGKCEHDHDHHHHAHDDKCGGEGKCEHESHVHGDGEHHEHHHAHEHHHHHHHHKKERSETRAAARFGIRSFVYARRRPFHPQRLRDMVLRWLPVTDNKALDGAAPGVGDSPIQAVLRSKGFMWMSSSHATAYYWSHAGQHFEVRDEGDWWAAVPDAEWPADDAQRAVILADFTPRPVGDRRQEIVFIGVSMDEAKISAQLDAALLGDEELARYEAKWGALPDPEHVGAP